LDVRNAFHINVQFDASKRTYNILPQLFAKYIRLHWPDRPDLPAIPADPKSFAIQNFRSMQGQKYTGRKWYHLLKGFPRKHWPPPQRR
jgi:hypothetical protein